MKKYFKYLLAVATLIIACATFALADGDPVTTLNGQPYPTISAAISEAVPGDQIVLVSSSTYSGALSIPTGVTFVIPHGITLNISSSNYINVFGNLLTYGSITRLNSSGSSNLITFKSGSAGSFFGDSYITSNSGTLLAADDGADVSIYGGDFFGYRYAVNASTVGDVSVYGGNFSSIETGPTRNLRTPFGLSALVVSDGVRSRTAFPVVSTITHIVNESLNWISMLCALFVANKLLLIFILFFMGFAAIGLIRRVFR